jgi:hypothetical protein
MVSVVRVARFEGRELGDPDGQVFLGIVHVTELLSASTSLNQIVLTQGCLLFVLRLNLFLVLAISISQRHQPVLRLKII